MKLKQSDCSSKEIIKNEEHEQNNIRKRNGLGMNTAVGKFLGLAIVALAIAVLVYNVLYGNVKDASKDANSGINSNVTEALNTSGQ